MSRYEKTVNTLLFAAGHTTSSVFIFFSSKKKYYKTLDEYIKEYPIDKKKKKIIFIFRKIL